MTAPLLTVANLSVSYGRVEAVRGVSIDVGRGEFVAMIGANGAGKSSLLKAISGIVRPAAGAIRFDGMIIDGRPSHEMVRHGIALVPEGRLVFSDQSIEDNLLLGGYTRIPLVGKRAVREDIEAMFDLFPRLKERRRQLAGSLSGGEQQMLAIARGLVSKPSLLMIDELSLGLAPRVLDLLFPVLVQLNQQGLSILLVEQLAARALAVATRGYVVENGRIVATGPSRELANDPRVVEAYLGKQQSAVTRTQYDNSVETSSQH
jgi:branched-chain amino acid transport system ATP-binding protein